MTSWKSAVSGNITISVTPDEARLLREACMNEADSCYTGSRAFEPGTPPAARLLAAGRTYERLAAIFGREN